jgi:histidine triad (HIT) family protein
MASLFTKIINFEIPSYKVFEDEFTFAFLDICPINLGHVLIVPKIEVENMWEVPEPYYAKIFENSKIISQSISKSTDCLRVCSWVEGFGVPHAHYHICPFYEKEGEFWSKKGTPQDSENLKKIQQLIISNL